MVWSTGDRKLDAAIFKTIKAEIRYAAARQVRAEGLAGMAHARKRMQSELDDLRLRMAARMRQTPEERGGAFVPLTDDELALLEWQLIQDTRAGRFWELSMVHDVNLATLRVNHIAGRALVTPEQFRASARSVCGAMATRVWAFASAVEEERAARHPVVVLPWRAGLIFGEVYAQMSTPFSGHHTFFRHVGIRRNERTLEPEVYFTQRGASDRGAVHLICDPMLATGGTTAAIVEQLRADRVPEERIIVQAIIAAPEGVDFLLRRYPGIAIVTAALDERLDARGYITGPGLGDFGDLAFSDIDEAYAEERWVRTGLLTSAKANQILARARAGVAGNG